MNSQTKVINCSLHKSPPLGVFAIHATFIPFLVWIVIVISADFSRAQQNPVIVAEIKGPIGVGTAHFIKECLDIGCIEVIEDYDASRSLSRMYGLKFAPGYGPENTRRRPDTDSETQ